MYSLSICGNMLQGFKEFHLRFDIFKLTCKIFGIFLSKIKINLKIYYYEHEKRLFKADYSAYRH